MRAITRTVVAEYMASEDGQQDLADFRAEYPLMDEQIVFLNVADSFEREWSYLRWGIQDVERIRRENRNHAIILAVIVIAIYAAAKFW